MFALRRWWVRSGLVALLFFILAYYFRENWLQRLGGALVQDDQDCRGEVVVVLAGDENGSRILRAAELVRQGRAAKVLVDGPIGSYGATEDQLAIPFAVKQGYPQEYFIPLPMRATSTRTEAAWVVRALQEHGWRRFVLVTSSFHTGRASRIFRQLTAQPGITFCTVPALSEHFTPATWWHSRDGMRVMFYESSKTIAEWLGL